ncbi:MAG: hypothetical protein ACQEP7_00700 [bacterium]
MIFLFSRDGSVTLPCNLVICDNFYNRLVGALKSGKIRRGEFFIFPGCSWPHTWFMRRSISILFYGPNGEIVSYLPRIRPFKFVKPVEAAGMIEMDSNRLGQISLAEYEYIRFSPATADRLGRPELSI